MKNDYPTKDVSNQDITPQEKELIEFNFPEQGITVKATSLEEATAELNKLTKQ